MKERKQKKGKGKEKAIFLCLEHEKKVEGGKQDVGPMLKSFLLSCARKTAKKGVISNKITKQPS